MLFIIIIYFPSEKFFVMTTENMPVSELRKYFENHFHHDLFSPTISIVTNHPQTPATAVGVRGLGA